MIIFMGPVGSGKSEQTHRLADSRGLQTISMSQLLRDALTPQRKARMLAGDLVDDEEIINLLRPQLAKVKATNVDFIMDGFPRSLSQAKWLAQQVKDGQVKLLAIFKLNVSNETVLKRLLARGREDDTKEIINHRLNIYYQTTDPVIDYLKSQNLPVYELDGEQPVEDVAQKIRDVIDEA